MGVLNKIFQILITTSIIFIASILLWPSNGEDSEIKLKSGVAAIDSPGLDDLNKKAKESEEILDESKNPQEEEYTDIVKKYPERLVIEVPFTPQAPLGEWEKDFFQDGCEEASMLMAMRWVRGITLTGEEAREEIVAIANFEEERYGNYLDTSAQDTLKVMSEYYNYHNLEIREIKSVKDIQLVIAQGKIAMVPTDGVKLGNPYFTPPGPENHMVVVVGYDSEENEIIVNDPGTKRGEKYHYDEDIFIAAARDYPTGFHEPNMAINKLMIVVGR